MSDEIEEWLQESSCYEDNDFEDLVDDYQECIYLKEYAECWGHAYLCRQTDKIIVLADCDNCSMKQTLKKRIKEN